MGVQARRNVPDLALSLPPILSFFPPHFLRVSITFAMHRADFSARPLRARSRHLPPLALFMVHCKICDPSIHLPSRVHAAEIARFPARRVGFVSPNLRLMKRVPALTNFTLSKPTKANTDVETASLRCPSVRILSFTFNFGLPPRRR